MIIMFLIISSEFKWLLPPLFRWNKKQLFLNTKDKSQEKKFLLIISLPNILYSDKILWLFIHRVVSISMATRLYHWLVSYLNREHVYNLFLFRISVSVRTTSNSRREAASLVADRYNVEFIGDVIFGDVWSFGEGGRGDENYY